MITLSSIHVTNLAAAISTVLLCGCSSTSAGSDAGTPEAGSPADSAGGNDSGPMADSGGGNDSRSPIDSAGGNDSGPPADSASGDSAGGNDWTCLGNETRSTAQATSPFTMTFANHTSNAPNAGVQVALCITGTLPSDCVIANPAGSVDASGTADATGTVVLTVNFANASGYQGIVHVVDPSNSMLEDIVSVNFVEDLHPHIDTFSQADITAASAIVGAIDLTNHALIVGKVLDCVYQPAASSSVAQASTDPTTKVAYFLNGALSASATATDASGEYMITNAPFALFGVTTTNVPAGPIAGITPQLVVGGVTTLLIPPTH
jgi:hypothetical protein